jgi:virulence factor Mce-like protein
VSRINTDRLKLEIRRARVPAVQYLFVLACAIFVAAIIFKNQLYDRPWESKRTYEVQFDDVKGVTPGKQHVRMAGVDVGLVTGSKLGADGKPVLTIKIRKKFGVLYHNAQMRLRPLTPLQDMYVDINSRGTPAAGELRSNQVLKNTQTVSPVDISRVMNTFDGQTQGRLRTLLTEFGRGLTDNGVQLKSAFVQLAPFLKMAQRTTQVLADRRQKMQRVVHNLGALTTALAHRDQQLTGLVRDGNATLASLSSQQRPFNDTLAQLPPTLSSVRSSFAALRSAEDQLDPALVALKPVAQNLRQGMAGLEKFSASATPALRDLRTPLRKLEPLAKQLRPTSTSLEQSFNRLTPQAPQFDDVTRTMVPCLDVMQHFFQDTLSVLKFYDVSGAFPRGSNVTNTDQFGMKGIGLKRLPSCTEGLR